MQGTNDPSRVELLDAAALCRHLVAEGSVYAFVADHRSELFPDQLFADLFPSGRGRPSVRRVRRLIPAAGALELAAHDYDHHPGKPQCAWDDPHARNGLVSALIGDALAVLA